MTKPKYPETLFNVVLVEPEIPNNTGNIGRTCVGLWSRLHLVEPLGFSLSDKYMKRAGLDYWQHLDIEMHKSWDQFVEKLPQDARVFVIETGSSKTIYDAEFRKGDYFIFGQETKGLQPAILKSFPDRIFSIPFPGQLRSFNLANAVAMVMSEAFRQVRQL